MFKYADPDAILSVVLPSPLKTNEAGHTVLDDFEHFCAYTGCAKDNAWAKLAFVSAATGGKNDDMLARIRELEENSAKAAALIGRAVAMMELESHGLQDE